MSYSGDRRPSPQPQTHAHLSYLSPSAAPFTVGHPRGAATPDPVPNAPANPSPYPDLPTAPSLYDSWVEPPKSYMDLEAGAAAGYRGFVNSDGFLVSENTHTGLYTGSHFGNTMQPHPFTTASSEWMEEKYPGIYQRTSKALPSDFGSSVIHQPSVSPNMFACLDKKRSTPQPVNQHSSYSAYDNYTTHLPSCSTYPLDYNLSMPPVSVSPEVCATTKSLSPTTDGHILENTFSSPYMNPCRLNLDYFDTMQNEQKDLFGHQTAYKHCGDWSNSDSGTRIMGSYPLSRRGVGENYPLGESSETGRPVQPGTYPLNGHGVGENYLSGDTSGSGRPVQPSSEVKSGFNSLQASSSNVSPSEHAFSQPRDLFIEPLEVNNPVVDSPCWKGTPTAQQSSFGVVKNDEAPFSANGSGDLHELHQSKKLSEFTTSNSVLFPKRHDTSNPANDSCQPYFVNYLSSSSLPSECKKSEGHSDAQPSIAGDFNCMARSSHPSYVSVDQGTRRDKHVTCKIGENSGNGVTPGQQGGVFLGQRTFEPIVLARDFGSHVVGMNEDSGKKVSSNFAAAPITKVRSLTKESLKGNTCVHKTVATLESLYSEMPMNIGLEHLTHCSPGVEESVKVSSDKVAYRSKTQEDLIKSIYNFSVVLLSTCDGGYELGESEHALVQSTIHNLSSLSSKISKAALKNDDANGKCHQSKSETIKCHGKNHQPENFDGLDWENIGADFKTFILEDLTKLPEENVIGDTKDAQMLIYKNLWIEAEASMCKLKYELQLARMKLVTKHYNQQTAAASANSLGEAKAYMPKHKNSSCFGGFADSSKQQNHVKERNIGNAALLPQGGDKVDADVFARLKVLKLRDESINCSREVNAELQKGTSNYNRTDVFDDTVFDNAVDDRITSLVEDIIKERSEASSSEGGEADGATIAALNGFTSCNNNTRSLDEGTNIEQAESSESKIHGAFMAKLKDLICCSDDISSSNEGNAHQLQTASKNEFGQLEDVVMARLQVLKRREDNNSSAVNEGQEVCHSDDWAGHFETKRLGRGAHDELIQKTDLPDNGGRRAQSDEADSKTASQYVSALLEEPCVVSAPAEPARAHTHDEQLSHSPPEWEHVLKEDFFLPGNHLK
ncbi:hypothetical protein ZWY2020_035437 [Hordeum vulgare]|nr:hypothetical protein ZWY2020_035437 [Hordeum vulgare]